MDDQDKSIQLILDMLAKRIEDVQKPKQKRLARNDQPDATNDDIHQQALNFQKRILEL